MMRAPAIMTHEELRRLATTRHGMVDGGWLLGWLCGRHGLALLDIGPRWSAAYERCKLAGLGFEGASIQAALDLDAELGGEP